MGAELVWGVKRVTAMRWAFVLVVASACAGEATTATGVPFLDSREWRRSELEASLVNPDNEYSRLRLTEYAVDGGWDALPEVDFDDGGVDPTDAAALVALGKRAFETFPMQEVPFAQGTFGGDHFVQGVGATFASCATCHARGEVRGLADAEFDIGRMFVANGQATDENRAARLSWGPGRLDVTTDAGGEVVRIPDLRPVRFQRFLQADASVRLRDMDTLAIRVDTLIITSRNEVARAPRVVPYAIAAYLWSLGEELPAVEQPAAFVTACSGCHAGEGLAGEPVTLAEVGTDPVVGRSAVRGTGMYGVPSLRGVGQRALLLHDGSVRSVEEMLDPASTRAGHRYGLDLADEDRESVITYLESL